MSTLAAPPLPDHARSLVSSPTLRAPALGAAAFGPLAIGALLAARTGTPAALVAAPAVVFGVVGATGPALYIATAATGHAPPLAAFVRAFAVAAGAFGIVLAGLLLPAAFLSLSSTVDATTFVVASSALGGAAALALWRLRTELAAASTSPSPTASWLFAAWALATIGIAGRLWWDLAGEVMP